MARSSSTYTDKVADLICERLSLGESLLAICSAKGMPPESTVRTWVADDREGFAAKYARARDAGLDARAEQVLEIADGEGDPVRDRLRVDARRWYLSKLAPKRYGDKVALEHGGSDGGPIQIGVTVNIQPVRPREDG